MLAAAQLRARPFNVEEDAQGRHHLEKPLLDDAHLTVTRHTTINGEL